MILVVAVGIPFLSSALPYSDLVEHLLGADSNTWKEVLRNAFRGAVEYRPLMHVSIKAMYELFGVRAWPYYALVLLQYGAMLGLLVILFRPIGIRRGIAATVALACFAGLHTSRSSFLLVPVNVYSASLILLLGAIVLAINRPNARLDWIFVFVATAAVLLLELGVVLLPVLLILFLARAPGVRWRGVLCTLIVVALYAAYRRRTGADVPVIYTETGLGFSAPSVEQLRQTFRHAPWMLYAYNTASTLFTVLFSEPRAGIFVFVQRLLIGAVPGYMWLHIVTSTCTTLFVAAVLMALRPFTTRDRHLIAAGLALMSFGSALGFLYTRDRIGLTAGVGYALLLYVCGAQFLERARTMAVWRRTAVAVVVSMLAVGWMLRTTELWFRLHDNPWDVQVEWRTKFGNNPAGAPDSIVERLRVDALSRAPSDPRDDPAWSRRLFERAY
jgi:hypothetical protein